MNILNIKIKGKEIVRINIEGNSRPYAFVTALYIILIMSTYYTTWMYPATMGREFDELTMFFVVAITSIYLAQIKYEVT